MLINIKRDKHLILACRKSKRTTESHVSVDSTCSATENSQPNKVADDVDPIIKEGKVKVEHCDQPERYSLMYAKVNKEFIADKLKNNPKIKETDIDDDLYVNELGPDLPPKLLEAEGNSESISGIHAENYNDDEKKSDTKTCPQVYVNSGLLKISDEAGAGRAERAGRSYDNVTFNINNLPSLAVITPTHINDRSPNSDVDKAVSQNNSDENTLDSVTVEHATTEYDEDVFDMSENDIY